ncbi:MAG: hypothetical protein ACLTYN_13600 [Dysosmobacter welbionis]
MHRKKQEQQHAIVLTHIAEKDFTFSEQMDLSPGREERRRSSPAG